MVTTMIDSNTATVENCEELYTYGIITETSNGKVIGFKNEHKDGVYKD